MSSHLKYAPIGRQMHESTRRVLEHVRTNPGCSLNELRLALPGLDVDVKLTNLRVSGYLESRRVDGLKNLRHFATVSVEKVTVVKLRGQATGQLPNRREVRLDEPWTEPYLTDRGVRSDGLEYRECPSRRGNQFVHCYRRVQP
jgi:hypothetical protein